MPGISGSRHWEMPSTRGIFWKCTATVGPLALLLVALLAAGCGRSTTQAQTSATHTAAAPTATTIAATPTLPPSPLTCAAGPTVHVPLTPVPSLPPAEILSAVEALPGFENPVQVAFAPSNSTYSYDPPVLVLPATVVDTEYSGGYYSLPHYIIRASVNDVRMVTYEVTYNPPTRAFRLDSWGPMFSNDPAYGKPFPWVGVSNSAAIAALWCAKGIALATSTAPELVFFAPGPQITNTKSPTPSTWTGGGYDPTYPMWRLHGADGQLYFVGIDGKVYTPQQLPILPGTTFITQA